MDISDAQSARLQTFELVAYGGNLKRFWPVAPDSCRFITLPFCLSVGVCVYLLVCTALVSVMPV
jgi:hypothetical protein